MFLEIDGKRGHGESRMLIGLDTLRTRVLPTRAGKRSGKDEQDMSPAHE
jgi:hypothetical protein